VDTDALQAPLRALARAGHPRTLAPFIMDNIFQKSDAGSVRTVWRGIFLWLLFMNGLFGLLLFGLVFRDGKPRALDIAIPIGIAVFIGLVWLIRSFLEWKRASPDVLPPNELHHFHARLESHWVSRYSIAISFLCLGASLLYGNLKPNLEWVPWLTLLPAAYFAKEVSFVLIALAGLYFVFWALASLPVGVAIIIGACIIAYAIYRRGNRG